jgi:hypothetical protein
MKIYFMGTALRQDAFNHSNHRGQTGEAAKVIAKPKFSLCYGNKTEQQQPLNTKKKTNKFPHRNQHKYFDYRKFCL